MRIIYIHILAVALLSSSVVVKAQDTFENLNFELANPGTLTHEPPYSSFANNVPVANALPYWSVFYGDVQQSTINVNDPSLGATAVTLYTTGYPVIDGNYSMLLQGGELEIQGVLTPEAASISQTDLIPAGTQYLLFEGEGYEPLNVLIGNQSVSLNALETGPNYTLYSANISAWADLTEQLTFSAPSSGGINNWEIDDISFSPTAVPEPSIVALTAMGGLLFGARKWFGRL